MLHGHAGHTSDQCKVLKAAAADLKEKHPRANQPKYPFKGKKDFKKQNESHQVEATHEFFKSFLTSEAYKQSMTKTVTGICNKLFKGYKRSLEDADHHLMETDENDAYDALMQLNRAPDDGDNVPSDESTN